MKFEEEFPTIMKLFNKDVKINPRTPIPLLAVKMHCVDKQRLKEAIEKVKKRIERQDGNSYPENMDYLGDEALKDLEQELGL